MSGISLLTSTTLPAGSGVGFSQLSRNFARIGSPRTSCSYPPSRIGAAPSTRLPCTSEAGVGKSSGYTSISFTTKSASVPVELMRSFGRTGPANVTSSVSGSVLVHQHIRTFRREALVVGHVTLRNRIGYIIDERHRMRRIAHISIHACLLRGRLEAQPTALVEVERLRRCTLGRPRRILLPHIRARLEDIRLRQRLFLLLLQILLKKWILNLLARRKTPVFSPKVASPSLSPSHNAHPPCVHGPMTRVFVAPGLSVSIA